MITATTHPDYYAPKSANGVECKDAMRSMLGIDGYEVFCRACVLKYLWRYDSKGGSKDLVKAEDYLHDLTTSVVSRELLDEPVKMTVGEMVFGKGWEDDAYGEDDDL